MNSVTDQTMTYLHSAVLAILFSFVMQINTAEAQVTARAAEFQQWMVDVDRLSIRANAGEAQAQYELAVQLARNDTIGGVSSTPNYVQARDFAHRAARQGHVKAQALVGFYMVQGIGGPEDPVNGIRWLTRAAEAGNATAQANLATAYAMGLGVVADPESAFKWFKKSAEQGSADGEY